MERNLTLVALFAALIAALGIVPQFSLTSGVPITAQSLGIMLAGAVLGARLGALATLLFLLLVAMGLPLLSGGRGGPGVFVSVSGGFIVGFPFAAFVTGLVMQQLRQQPILLASGVAALIGGVGVLYLFGIPGMMWTLDKSLGETLLITSIYLPGDLIKVFLTAVICRALYRARPQSLLSRL